MALFNLDQIKRVSAEKGHLYFKPGGERGFRPRYLSPILATPYGAVFVESTSNGIERRYTVRYIDERDGRVIALSGFEEYKSATGAKGRAKREQARLRTEQAQVYGEQVRYFLASNGFMGDVDCPVEVLEVSGSLVGIRAGHGRTAYGIGRAEVLRDLLKNEAPKDWEVRAEWTREHGEAQGLDGDARFTVTLPETQE